ncbi:MAG TPA: malto-oligosyltrehalose trehalohydrolase [Acidimicrobiales bacterium]|jgi:maltooligosyltrehalose trehalohydrolase|nr:malto-oligosyltrehalose trehalohydrolase [Acidimicrobiales bacterium]
MSDFTVWAPGHEAVEVDLAGRRVAMVAVAAGWWHAYVDGAGAGTRYRFCVDGGPALPDPRSPWQPDGIDGPSATVDHACFPWTDRAWRGAPLASAVIYECHVGTFSPEGTFDGAIARLDHLVDLGATAIELLPVAEASGDRGWGYDGVLLWAPHHAYGGPTGLKRLVDAAHARGIAVVLDVVYNHLGPSGNHLAKFGPYFTDRYQTPWGEAVNFDGAGSDGVRRFVIDNARMWLEDYHLDGLRLDAVHAIVDESALHVLEEMAVTVGDLSDHLGRQLWLIAESDRNDPRLVRSREAGGYGLAASWSDDFHHALHAVLTGERSGYYEDFGRLSQVATALRRVYVYGRDWSPFRQRHHGRPAGELPGTRFLGYSQNHDQVGNRAVGDRTAALMSPGRLKIAAALVLCSPFVPMIFQGEEWGASTPFQYFTDHRDPELGQAVSEGRRREFAAFGWAADDVPDPQDPATFERSKLDWLEVGKEPHSSLLGWCRDLIALRRRHSELTDGHLNGVQVDCDDGSAWLCMRRGRVAVAVNLAATTRELPVAAGELALASEPGVDLRGATVRLPPESVAVVISQG